MCTMGQDGLQEIQGTASRPAVSAPAKTETPQTAANSLIKTRQQGKRTIKTTARNAEKTVKTTAKGTVKAIIAGTKALISALIAGGGGELQQEIPPSAKRHHPEILFMLGRRELVQGQRAMAGQEL